MAKKEHQCYGNGPKDGTFFGNFTRSGKEGQFKLELKQETIDFVLERFPNFTKIYSSYFEN